MFFFLSKTIFYLSMPLVWISFFLISSVITKSSIKRRKRIIIGLSLLFFFSNGFIANECFKWWEEEAITFEETPKATYGIILSGFTNNTREPNDRVYLSKGADRLMHTVYLYQLGKIDTIVVTGGVVSVLETKEKITEAEKIGELLQLCGIPENKIILEKKARNTHENAAYTSEIVKKNTSILVTSAFHMKRAKACFKKENISFTSFAVDYYSHKLNFGPAYTLIPSEQALSNWAKLIHEIVGYTVYKLMGYA